MRVPWLPVADMTERGDFRFPGVAEAASIQAKELRIGGAEQKPVSVTNDDAGGFIANFDDIGVEHDVISLGAIGADVQRVQLHNRHCAACIDIGCKPIFREMGDAGNVIAILLYGGAHEEFRGALAFKFAAQAARSNPAA